MAACARDGESRRMATNLTAASIDRRTSLPDWDGTIVSRPLPASLTAPPSTGSHHPMGALDKLALGGVAVLAVGQAVIWYQFTDASPPLSETAAPARPSAAASPTSEADLDALRARVALLERHIGTASKGDGAPDHTVALDARIARVEARLAAHRSMLLPGEIGDDELIELADKAKGSDPERALMLFEALHDRAPEGSESSRLGAMGAMKSANDLKDGVTMRHYAEALSDFELSEAEQQTVATHGAFALEHLGRIDEAVQAHQAAADKWPDERIAATTYWNLALIMLRAARREDAKGYLQLIVDRFGDVGVADDIVRMAKEQLAKLT
jgi:tetratricopeptide (TPR) repeat protein